MKVDAQVAILELLLLLLSCIAIYERKAQLQKMNTDFIYLKSECV